MRYSAVTVLYLYGRAAQGSFIQFYNVFIGFSSFTEHVEMAKYIYDLTAAWGTVFSPGLRKKKTKG